jgi:hypothetical protein
MPGTRFSGFCGATGCDTGDLLSEKPEALWNKGNLIDLIHSNSDFG